MPEFILLNQWTIIDICRSYESLESIQDLSKLQLLKESFQSACKQYKFTIDTECYINSDGVPVFFDLYSTFDNLQAQDESAYVLAKIEERINTSSFVTHKRALDPLICTLDPVYSKYEEGLKMPKTFQLAWLYDKNSKRLINIINKVKCKGNVASMCKSQLDDLTIYRGLSYTEEASDNYKVTNQVDQFYSLIQGESQVQSVLDFGGGSGDFLAHLQQHHQTLFPSQPLLEGVCMEVAKWYSKTHVDKYPSIKYLYTSSYKLSLLDESFDCVCSLHVLHHCDQVVKTLKELYRVLKVGGLLFLREHDAYDKEDHVAIDIEHLLYEVVCRRNEMALRSYFGTYFTKRYLYSMLQDVGFKFIADTKKSGVTNSYYTLWAK